MDANRLQLAAALKARPQLGQPQTGGQMTQQGYAQRPGIPTRQGMPQPDPMPGLGGGGMQPAQGNGGFQMFGGAPKQSDQDLYAGLGGMGQVTPQAMQQMQNLSQRANQFKEMQAAQPSQQNDQMTTYQSAQKPTGIASLGFGSQTMQPAQGAGGFQMFGGAPSQQKTSKPSMGTGGQPMAQPRY